MGTSAFRDSLDYSIEPSPDGDVLRVQGEVNFITAEKLNGLLQGFVVGRREATVDLVGIPSPPLLSRRSENLSCGGTR